MSAQFVEKINESTQKLYAITVNSASQRKKKVVINQVNLLLSK